VKNIEKIRKNKKIHQFSQKLLGKRGGLSTGSLLHHSLSKGALGLESIFNAIKSGGFNAIQVWLLRFKFSLCDSSPALWLHRQDFAIQVRHSSFTSSRAVVPPSRTTRAPSSAATALPGLDADAIQADNREALCLICIGALVAGRRRCDFILQKTER
jgi:hypothetical protein